MWVLPVVCLSGFLPADFFLLLSLLTRMWVPPLVCLICYLLISLSVSACQDVSAISCLSCLLTADFCIVLFLLARLWVLPLLHALFSVCWPLSLTWSLFVRMQVLSLIYSIHCLLTSLAFCLCSPDCECYPLSILFCLLTSHTLCLCLPGCEYCFHLPHSLHANLPLIPSLLSRMWVLPLVYPVCCLLISLFVSACQDVSAASHSSHSWPTNLYHFVSASRM